MESGCNQLITNETKRTPGFGQSEVPCSRGKKNTTGVVPSACPQAKLAALFGARTRREISRDSGPLKPLSPEQFPPIKPHWRALRSDRRPLKLGDAWYLWWCGGGGPTDAPWSSGAPIFVGRVGGGVRSTTSCGFPSIALPLMPLRTPGAASGGLPRARIETSPHAQRQRHLQLRT